MYNVMFESQLHLHIIKQMYRYSTVWYVMVSAVLMTL